MPRRGSICHERRWVLLLLFSFDRLAQEYVTDFLVCLGGKTPDPHAKGRGYAEIMGEVVLRNAKVGLSGKSVTL